MNLRTKKSIYVSNKLSIIERPYILELNPEKKNKILIKIENIGEEILDVLDYYETINHPTVLDSDGKSIPNENFRKRNTRYFKDRDKK